MRTPFHWGQPSAGASPKMGLSTRIEVGISWIISLLLLAIIAALIVALMRG